jgi:UDP-glucose 4-epimerase
MRQPIEGKVVFVTGGAGFIGSTLVGALVEQNQVVVYDNLSRDSLKDRSYATHPHLRRIEGDVLDEAHLSRAMEGADYVVHCAGITGIDTVHRHPVSTLRVNAIGTANVLEAACRLPRCARVLCFSTSEIFGRFAFRSAETDNAVIGGVGEDRWTYAASKLCAEHLAIAYAKERKLPVTVLRPFNVYGPGQVGEGALRTFVRRALLGQPLEIHGDGTQIRAWCYVDDAIECMLRAMVDERAIGQSFNLGNPQTVCTIYNLASTVVRVLGSPSPVVLVRADHADVELRVPSVVKARELLGFDARVSLEEGIRRTADYYRDHAFAMGEPPKASPQAS